MLKTGEIVDLFVERLALGGDGVGRHKGFVVFVPFVAPAENIRCRITEIKKNFARGELVEVVAPGASRVKAPCPIFGKCGGCSWQHLDYEQQLFSKQQILERLAKKISPSVKIDEIVASPLPFHYRNRIQIHIKNGKTGFLKKNSHEFIPTQNCLIADEKISALLNEIPQRHRGSKKVEIGLDAKGKIYERPLDADTPLFSQVNPIQNRQLVDFVAQIVTTLEPKRVIDFYCGAGNFTFPIARQNPSTEVVGVEMSAELVAAAEGSLSNLNNIYFIRQGALEFLRENDLSNAVVLLDPPRTGCELQFLQLLKEKKPLKIIYVSCNPATAERDWKILGGTLELVRAFDMFPQTDHIEIVGVLR